MEQVFSEIWGGYQNAYDTLLAEEPKVVTLYAELKNQRDAAHSKTVKKLLNAELDAYYALCRSFDKVVEIQGAEIESSVESAKSLVSNCSATQLEKMEEMYYLNCIIPAKNTIELYSAAVNRDFKDWAAFKQMVLQIGIDKIVSLIPIAAEVKSFFDTVGEIKDIVDAYNENGTDYSEIDKQLFKIEVHIEIMKNTTQLFLYHAELLSGDK